ncbi:MAG: PKD domain-containing protein, partial [Bacteroidota bacterium]
LTHEIGHRFGLLHVYQGVATYSSPPTSSVCTDDYLGNPFSGHAGDYCTDTDPVHGGGGIMTCASVTGIPFLYDCNGVSFGTYRSHVENFMQAGGPPECRLPATGFTPDQIGRMRCFIYSRFSSYLTYTASTCPQWPVAEFTASPLNPCVGGTVQFTSTSSSDAISWAWNFGDGTTSTLENPTHVYTAPGEYSVTLVVNNASGPPNTTTKIDYITVTEEVLSLPYLQDFEGDFPPAHWSVENPDGDALAWTSRAKNEYRSLFEGLFYPTVPYDSLEVIGSNGQPTRSAAMPQGLVTTANRDYLITPDFDLGTCLNDPTLAFDLSFLPTSSPDGAGNCNIDYSGMPGVIIRGNGSPLPNYFPDYYDKQLRIDISVDCGATWTNIYDKDTDQLKTLPEDCGAFRFTPLEAGHWRKDVVDLSAFLGANKARFRFEIRQTYFSNSLYIDNFELYDALPKSLSVTAPATLGCDLSNGEIDMDFVNADPPVSYVLNGGPSQSTGLFSGLTPGDYNLEATDAEGCTLYDTLTIVGDMNVNITVDSTDCATANGAFHFVVSNGLPPYDFTLMSINEDLTTLSPVTNSFSVTGLIPGPYIVDISNADGCMYHDTIVIPTKEELVYAGFGISPVDCGTWNFELFGEGPSGTTATLEDPSGSSFPIAFNTPAPHLTLPGDYILEMTEPASGCVLRDTITIPETLFLPYTLEFEQPTCLNDNGTVTIEVDAVGLFSYTLFTDDFSYANFGSLTTDNPHTIDELPAGN